MLIKNYCILVTSILLLFSCNKKSPTEPEKKVSSVSITEIKCDKSTVTLQDTVRLECIASSTNPLHYHWDGITNLIDRENKSSSFDWGQWIRWNPPYPRDYYIEVLAYTESGIGSGTAKRYYEYHPTGQIKSVHTFYESEKGKSWDIKGIGINVEILNWTLQTGNKVQSSPAIGSDGTVYVGSADGYLYAVNSDGTEKWKNLIGYDNLVSSPAIDLDGTIYIGTDWGHFYAINSDGTEKWEFQTELGIESSPAIDLDGTIYIFSTDKHLYAINPDGTKKWEFQLGGVGIIAFSPAIGAGGTIYIGSWDKYLYAINPDGTLKWKYEANLSISSSPTIGPNETIYVGVDNAGIGYLLALKADGSEKFRCFLNYDGGQIISSPAIDANGTIYVGSSNGMFYVNSKDYKFYAIDPDGTVKWEYQTDDPINSSPVIGPDGMIYVGSDNGKIYSFTGNGGLANSQWPMFSHDCRHTGRK